MRRNFRVPMRRTCAKLSALALLVVSYLGLGALRGNAPLHSGSVVDTAGNRMIAPPPPPFVLLAQQNQSTGNKISANPLGSHREGGSPIPVTHVELDHPGFQVSSAVHVWVTAQQERIAVLSPAHFIAEKMQILYYPNNAEPESLTCENVNRSTYDRVVSHGPVPCEELLTKLMQEADLSPKFTHVAANDTLKPTSSHWLPGTTMYMFLKPSASNIAHYAGRILMFEHLLVHAGRMGLADVKDVNRIVVQAPASVCMQILKNGSWHNGALRAIVGPQVLFIPYSADDDMRAPGLYIVPDNEVLTAQFERLIVPAFLKGRYFVPDSELIASPRDIVHGVERPSSASHWLSNVHRTLGRDSVPQMKKKLVYLKRLGRRAFNDESELRVANIMAELSSSRGFVFSQVVFSGAMTFQKQIAAVEDAAVAVGLHGANLVQTMALPRGAAMIEIFPFGWKHTMYVEGGRAGVHYTALNVSSGEEYDKLDTHYGGDRHQCMIKSIACKNFYRSDVRSVDFPVSDTELLRTLLTRSIEHALLSIEGA